MKLQAYEFYEIHDGKENYLYHSQSGEEILHPDDDAGRTFKGKG
jgi:hypothetical protein